MKESIKFIGVDREGQDWEYELQYEDNVLSIIDVTAERELFSADWNGNLKEKFERALLLWDK